MVFLIAFLSLVSIVSPPTVTSDCYDNTFCIDTESKDDRVDVFVRSLVDWEITMTLDVESTNLKPSIELPTVKSVSVKRVSRLLTLVIDDKNAGWSFGFNVKWILGDFTAEHKRGIAYDLPYAQGQEFLVGQGYMGNATHQGKYALDWDMPEGTPVLAARGGMVVDIEESFSEGRPDPDLMTQANYVKSRHSDGTIGNYVHLKHKGVKVHIGQKVRAGDVIGFSGNTGFTTGPHLHFEVYSATRELGRRTIPVEFNTNRRGAILLKEGQYYGR